MASRKQLEFLIQGRDQLSRPLVNVAKGFLSVSKNATTAKGKLDGATRASEQATKASKGLSSALTGVVSALGGFAALSFAKTLVSDFAEFEDRMLEVKAVTQATVEQYEALSATAQRMGETTRYTAAQAAEGMKYLAMAGLDVQEVIGAIPSTLQLAAAANMDLGQAADITTNILSGFKKTVEELGHVNDVLVKTFTNANTSLGELGEAFSYAAPIASAMRQDFEEMNAVVGKLADSGIKASRAGTVLRGALQMLADPSREAAETLKELGVSVYDSQGQMRGFTAILEDLEKAGASTTQVMRVFGKIAGSGVVSLMNQGSASIRELEKTLSDVDGTAQGVAETMEEGLGGQLRAIQSKWDSLKKKIVSSVLPAIKGLLDGLEGLVEAFNSLPESAQKLIAATSMLALVFGGLALTLAPLATALAGMKIAFVGVAGEAIVAEGAIASFGATAATVAGTIATVAAASAAIAAVPIWSAWKGAKEAALEAEEAFVKAHAQIMATWKATAKFGNYKLPDDFASAPLKQLEEFDKKLKLAEVNVKELLRAKELEFSRFEEGSEAAQKLAEDIEGIKERLQEISNQRLDLKGLLDPLKQGFSEYAEAARDAYKQQRAAAKNAHVEQLTMIDEELEDERQALDAKLEANRQYITDSEIDFKKFYANQYSVLNQFYASGQYSQEQYYTRLLALESQYQNDYRSLLEDQKSILTQHLNDASQRYVEYYQKRQAIIEKYQGRILSREQKLEEIRIDRMTDSQKESYAQEQYYKTVAEIAQKRQKIEQTLAEVEAGRLEMNAKLRAELDTEFQSIEKLIGQGDRYAGMVDEGSRAQVDMLKNLNRIDQTTRDLELEIGLDEFEQARSETELLEKAIAELGEKIEASRTLDLTIDPNSMRTLENAASEIERKFSDLGNVHIAAEIDDDALEDMRNRVENEKLTAFLGLDASEAESQHDQLRREMEKPIHTKWIIDKEVRGGDAPGFALGGLVQKFATGGLAFKRLLSPYIPGYGTKDDVPAMLMRGEYVIRRDAVRKYGLAFLNMINGMKMPEIPKMGPIPQFASGGYVSPMGGGDFPEFSGLKGFGTINLSLDGGKTKYPVITRENILKELEANLERKRLTRGR